MGVLLCILLHSEHGSIFRWLRRSFVLLRRSLQSNFRKQRNTKRVLFRPLVTVTANRTIPRNQRQGCGYSGGPLPTPSIASIAMSNFHSSSDLDCNSAPLCLSKARSITCKSLQHLAECDRDAFRLVVEWLDGKSIAHLEQTCKQLNSSIARTQPSAWYRAAKLRWVDWAEEPPVSDCALAKASYLRRLRIDARIRMLVRLQSILPPDNPSV